MSPQTRPRPDLPADAGETDGMACGDLELPRPWRLILTAGWNLAESLGLPIAGYLAGAMLGGRAVGMVAATGMVWLTVAVRKVAARSVPGLLAISALVLTLQTALVIATGSMLVFLLQFPLANLALCVLFARTARTRKPLVAQLATEVVGLRQPSSRHPGLDRFFQEATWLWAAIFAASAAGLAVAIAIASADAVELLTTAVTIGGVVAGAFLSVLWFVRVLRRLGLHVRLDPVAAAIRTVDADELTDMLLIDDDLIRNGLWSRESHGARDELGDAENWDYDAIEDAWIARSQAMLSHYCITWDPDTDTVTIPADMTTEDATAIWQTACNRFGTWSTTSSPRPARAGTSPRPTTCGPPPRPAPVGSPIPITD
jgi:hypothetical protein